MSDQDTQFSREPLPYSDALLDPDSSFEVMVALMDYFVKLNKVVKTKVSYASEATEKRVNELNLSNPKANSLQKTQKLKNHLEELSDVLKTAELSIEEIENIHVTLDELPGKAKVYYDHLVALDHELCQLVAEITSDEYQKAYKRATKISDTIQKGRNLLSGNMPQEEFGIDHKKNYTEPVKEASQNFTDDLRGYKILPNGKKVKVL